FLKQLTARENRPLPPVTKQAMHALMAYNWPGNIRELRNAVERMVVLDTDGRLDVDDLPEEIAPLGESIDDAGLGARGGVELLIGRPLTDVEKYYIERALELSGGRREEAATMLGIGERTLYRKIKEYDIKA